MDVTFVFPVKNEEENLPKATTEVLQHGPVVVVDSGSTDSTVSIARRLGAEVVQFKWNGVFPKKRNWVLRNFDFQTEWVLFLDADEFVSASFLDELQRTLDGTPHVGFWLNFENYFMGKLLRHGDPMRKLALFRVGAGEYERIEEDSWSQLDMEVHEHPILTGSVGEIRSPIQHCDYRGIGHWVQKHNAYSDWEANRFRTLVQHGLNASNPEWKSLNSRQKRKYGWLHCWWFGPAYGLNSFLLKQGFRDGYPGCCFAILKAWYFWTIHLKVRELRRRRKGLGT